jgi:hypothetical protein
MAASPYASPLMRRWAGGRPLRRGGLWGPAAAYTVDGGELGELEYENFNAASATVTVHGLNIHPGSAKNKMKNAALMAVELVNMLPPAETPAHTEGYEGFYHLNHMEGNETQARLSFIIGTTTGLALSGGRSAWGLSAPTSRQVWPPHLPVGAEGLLL